jgi:DNA-binding NarL/FixJ family response regulator
MIRVLIAEDHAMMREGLRKIIDCSEGMTTVGAAADGMELLNSFASTQCDLLIMDMSMPGVGGVDLIRKVRIMRPELPILVMSIHDAGKIASAALRAGANGYMTKNADPIRLPAIIRSIVSGGSYVEPLVANKIIFDGNDLRPPHELLTEREFQILQMIVAGKSTKQIACDLFISPKTVSTHKMRIMEKMEMDNAADLVRYALKHHLNGTAPPDLSD